MLWVDHVFGVWLAISKSVEMESSRKRGSMESNGWPSGESGGMIQVGGLKTQPLQSTALAHVQIRGHIDGLAQGCQISQVERMFWLNSLVEKVITRSMIAHEARTHHRKGETNQAYIECHHQSCS